MGKPGFVLSIILLIITMSALYWRAKPDVITTSILAIIWLASSYALLNDNRLGLALTITTLSLSIGLLILTTAKTGGIILASTLLLTTLAQVTCISAYETEN